MGILCVALYLISVLVWARYVNVTYLVLDCLVLWCVIKIENISSVNLQFDNVGVTKQLEILNLTTNFPNDIKAFNFLSV